MEGTRRDVFSRTSNFHWFLPAVPSSKVTSNNPGSGEIQVEAGCNSRFRLKVSD